MSAVVIVGATWWLLAAGSGGVNVATVLALTVAMIALAMAILDRLPGTVPQEKALAAEAARLARAVAQAAAAERSRLFGDGDAQPADVSFTRYPGAASLGAHALRWREDGGATEGTLAGIAGYYSGLGRKRLVVLGDPGSGKSVLVTLLALELATQAATQTTTPDGASPERVRVPVRLSLPAFDPGEGAAHAAPEELATRMLAWIAGHLEQVYGVRPGAAAALVDGGWILPMLDGLDEMDREGVAPVRARAAVRALNHTGPQGLPALVLACREPRYRRLAEERTGPGRASVLQDATAIRIEPLTPTQVRDYLTARFPHPGGPAPDGDPRAQDRWQPILDRLRDAPQSDLARVLGSPLTLFLAVTGYDDPASEPARLLRLDASGIQGDLLDRLIPALTAHNPRPEDGSLYNPHAVARWLATLSRHLHDQQTRGGSGTDLYLHNLWRTAGSRAPRYYAATALTLATAAPLLALAAVYIHASGYLLAPDWRDRIAVVAGVALVVGVFFVAAEGTPALERLDFRAVWTRRTAADLATGLASGLVAALTAQFTGVFPVGLWGRLALGLTMGLTYGLASGLGQEQTSIEQPRQLVRQGIVRSTIVTPMFGLTLGLTVGLTRERAGGLMHGLTSGLVVGIAAGLATGLAVGSFNSPWPRYAAGVRILARRGLLPRRPARFLDWACAVGLMKVSGIAVQFRHQSLQAHLLESTAAVSSGEMNPSQPVQG